MDVVNYQCISPWDIEAFSIPSSNLNLLVHYLVIFLLFLSFFFFFKIGKLPIQWDFELTFLLFLSLLWEEEVLFELELIDYFLYSLFLYVKGFSSR